jgi:photosystem II stability/assembly factor-like uncharacterized protein
MSDQLRDELLKRVSDVMSAEDVNSANDSSENESQRAQAVLARVMENVQSEESPRRHVKRPYWLSARSFRGRVVVTASVALAMILLVGVLVSIVGGNSRLDSPITTSRQSGKSLITKQVGSTALPRHGTWLLADGSLSGTWQQIPVGPPGVGVTCPTASACYEMEEVTAAPVENSPLLSVSFYASTDDGVTWTEYSMPSGFSPTTTLSCGSDSDCDAGGTYNGQSVLVSTTDGGHSFTVAPLPSTVGTLFSLSCSSGQFCGGLASEEAPYSPIYHPGALEDGQPTNATFLSTDDNGSTFTSTAITPGNSLWTLECTSSLDCVTLGDQGNLSDGTTDWAEGVFETTNDGGNTWTSTNMPSGFAVSHDSILSCADALHCSVSGQISVPFENPPACATMNHPSNSPTSLPVTAGAPSAALETIVQFESSLITSANLKAIPNTEGFGCSWPPETRVSDIVSTTDGGNTWTPEQLPASVPAPSLLGLSCPTDNDCWASGSDENVQQVPGGANNTESVLLGTTDGGATWSTVTFNVPSGTPSFQSSFGDGIGSISCPTANVCAANGVGMADAASLPFYSLAIPSSTT